VAGERYDAASTQLITSADVVDSPASSLGILAQGPAGPRRIELAFAANGDSWWIDRITVVDDTTAPGPGVTLIAKPLALSPLGQAFEGDIDLAADGPDGPVRLVLDDARIRFLPAGVAANGGAGTKPAQFGDELACTGILQQPPVIADVRLKSQGYTAEWRWQFATGPNTGQSQVVDGPPADGYISGTAPGPTGTIVVFVEDPTNPSMPRLERPATCLVP
jgi:hypothetical protein